MKTIMVVLGVLCLCTSLAVGGNLDIVFVEDVSASCHSIETNINNLKRSLIMSCEPGDHFERVKNGCKSEVVISNYVTSKDDCTSMLALSLQTDYPLLADYDLADAIENGYMRLLQRMVIGSECKPTVILITDGMVSADDAQRVSQLIAKMQSHGISFYMTGTKKTNGIIIRAALEYGATYADIETAQPAIWIDKLRASVNVSNRQDRKAEITELDKQIEESQKRLRVLSEDEQGKKNKLSEIQKVLEQRTTEANTAKNELVQLNQQRGMLTKSIADLNEQCRQNELKQQAVNAQIEESKRNLHKTDNQCGQLKSELSDLKSKQIAMKQKIAQKERILADANNLLGKQGTTTKQTQGPDRATVPVENLTTKPDSDKLQKNIPTKNRGNSIYWPWVVIPAAVIVLLAIGFYSLLSWLRRREFQMTISCITSAGRNIANDIHILPKCEVVPLIGERLESEIAKEGQTDYAYIYVGLFGHARLCANGENATNVKVNGNPLSSSTILLNLGDSIEISLQEGCFTYILADLCTATVSELENLTTVKVA